METFRSRTIKGITWSVISQVGGQTFAFVVGITLARLLSPDDFGLVGMVMIFAGFAAIFRELGFGAALIEKKDVQQKHLSSVFWINIGSGVMLMTVFMLASPLIAAFYRKPLLTPLTMVISVNFLIGSFGIVQGTLMTKSLEFRTLSIINIFTAGVSGLVAVIMAYLGFGVWSLVVHCLLGSILGTALLWRYSSWRPTFVFKWEAAKELLRFSTSVLGTRVLSYWVRNLDNLLIGRFFGTGALGIYQKSYSIMLFPLANVSRVIGRVLFPSLSLIQDEKKRVKSVYLRSTRTVALFTFPMMLGLFVVCRSFVLGVLGAQWAEMISILKIFCFLGITQSILTLVGSLYQSQGRADLELKIGLILKLNLVVGIVIGLHLGIFGVAVGFGIASVVNSYPAFFYAGRLVDLTFTELLKALRGIFACATIMAVLVWGLRQVLPLNLTHWMYLAIQVPFGILIYALLIHVLDIPAYQDLREILKEYKISK